MEETSPQQSIMQSKNKKAMSLAEREHVERVAQLACVICDAAPPSEVHEIVQGDWWLSCALCPDCHRGGFNGIHGQKRIWAATKVTELGALSRTIRRLV
jgi:hypothetical protein